MNEPKELKQSSTGQAICNVMVIVERLKKDHNNAFAKYKYTSVDDFKDYLRPKMAEQGIWVSVSEKECEIIAVTSDDKGKQKEKTHLKFCFSCALNHVSGEPALQEEISVMLPYVGAQTSGQARSYAIKEYLKSAFLASSGDIDDADADSDAEQLSKQAARPIYKELTDELRAAAQSGETAMKEWAHKRKPSIHVMPKDWQIMLQKQYKEFIVSPPATIENETEKFLRNAKDELAVAEDSDAIQDIWNDKYAPILDDLPAEEREELEELFLVMQESLLPSKTDENV